MLSPGQIYERRLDPDRRRRLGAYYTPAPLADELAAATLDDPTMRVCDPAVGAGALLLAAARRLLALGASPASLAHHQLAGADVDAGAVDVARAGLRQLLGHEPRLLRVADSLAADAWPAAAFDAVLTNPPFLSQLQRRTARTRDEAETAVDRWGPAAMGYADSANLFLLLAVDLVADGGRVGIILPEPLLAARDGLATRRHVGGRTTLRQLWRPGLGAFDAGVRVFVAVLTRADGATGDWRSGSWSAVASRDVPQCALDSDGVVGDAARVTADFRDQYYGVAAIARDVATGEAAPLVTCGLIDPARMWWGRRPATIARTRMTHPRADVAALSAPLQRWAEARMVPKILVATQTRVLEAAVDVDGTWRPVVPVITVVPAPEQLWRVLAALLAPPVAAHAHRTHTGSALSADAIKLSARQVAALPLPRHGDAWDRGAEAGRCATVAPTDRAWMEALDRMGWAMCEAYGVDGGSVMPWWTARLDRLARRHAIGS